MRLLSASLPWQLCSFQGALSRTISLGLWCFSAVLLACCITPFSISPCSCFSAVSLQLFANLYLAGTIIFSGAPVVIPLLREYVAAEGWVSPRDFLIGLSIAQAFSGPNSNFAVFLGTLAASNSGNSSIAGAVIAFGGIFFPGIVLVHGTMGVWSSLRNRRWFKSGLKGANAGSVGLIYTAVYRIWQVGYLDEGFQSGRSLGDDRLWVVVTATAYVGGRYYGVSAPAAIVLVAIMGLIGYGVVSGRG